MELEIDVEKTLGYVFDAIFHTCEKQNDVPVHGLLHQHSVHAGVLSDIWKRSASIFVMQSSVGVLSNVIEIHSDRVKV